MKLKPTFSNFIQKPVLWVVLIILATSINKVSHKGSLGNIITSDGKGYYAYLPALFIFNDPTFEQSMHAESKYEGEGYNQLYLYKTQNGKITNKYFPGIAVLQAPFFAAACIYSVIMDLPVDGYSNVFQLFFYLGSLFYSIMGIVFFGKCLKLLFPNKDKHNNQLLISAILGTPLIYYLSFQFGLSHLYTFFMFGWFSFSVLQLKKSITLARVVLIGFILGLITVIRPTNILVVFMIPFLLGDSKIFMHTLKEVFIRKRHIGLLSTIGFLLPVFLLLSVFKWQTGHWISWPYSGEGFDFLHPHFFGELFSFRVGLFIHTPLTLLAVIGTIYLYRINKFQFLFWWIYFILQLFIISSWWCWDFETSFGNRPFTEHLFFIL